MREAPETDRAAIQTGPATRIGKLITDLCPDGVKYRKLYDVTH